MPQKLMLNELLVDMIVLQCKYQVIESCGDILSSYARHQTRYETFEEACLFAGDQIQFDWIWKRLNRPCIWILDLDHDILSEHYLLDEHRKRLHFVDISVSISMKSQSFVHWVIEHGHVTGKDRTFYYACKTGDLNIVKTFWNNRVELETRKDNMTAMDLAASGGHLHVLKWLAENSDIWFTNQALGLACASGHEQVVEWLLTECDASCTKSAICVASHRGYLHILKCLEECSSTFYSVLDAIDEVSPIEWAAENGHLAVLKFFYDEIGEGNENTWMNSMILAARRGHEEVVMWLYSHVEECSRPECLYQALAFAVKNDHHSVVLPLLRLCRNVCVVFLLKVANQRRHLNLPFWLYDQLSHSSCRGFIDFDGDETFDTCSVHQTSTMNIDMNDDIAWKFDGNYAE